MAKRFTDSNKWRNEWFRTLPIKAKLTWTYLCDECESHGVMKMDYGLASFQLGFQVAPELLKEWFGNKLYFFDNEKFLIVQYFNFQYGESKDTWSAKVEAKKKIEVLGFTVENNEVKIPYETQSIHSDPTVVECTPTPLIRVRVRGRVSIKGGVGENEYQIKIEKIYSELYPLKKGKSNGIKEILKQIKTPEDLEDFEKSVKKYADNCRVNRVDPKYIKHFSTFVNTWRDWLDPDAGKSLTLKNYENERDTDHDAEVAEMWGT